MGSYERLPTTENVFNNIDELKLTPKPRNCFLFPPLLGCWLVFLAEFLAYYFCRREKLINTAICITSITYGVFIHSLYECLSNFHKDGFELTIIFGGKLVSSVILMYLFDLVPYVYSSVWNVILFGILSAITFSYFKFFKTNSWNSICTYSTKNPPLGEALAHQTYEGFFAKVLPKIRKEIRKLTKEENIPADLHFIILLPRSGLQTDKLIENDITNNLKIADGLIVITEDNGGTVKREYKIRKYKIQRQNDNSLFYCFFDVPSSLGNMYKMVRKINDSREYMWEQYQIYFHTLRDCIENDTNCMGNYKIIAYNDIEKEGGCSIPLSLIIEKIVDGKEDQLNLIT